MSTQLRQLHVSGLDTLSRCGEQFRRRYIEGERVPPAAALHVGTSVHKSVEANLTAKMAGEPIEQEEAIAAAYGKLVGDWDQYGVTLDEDDAASPEQARGAAIDKAVRLSRHHFTEVAPSINPTHVERRWTLAITGYDFELAGSIDIQIGTELIRDTKTSGKTPSGNPAETSIQLPMYALAVEKHDGAAPKSVQLDYLIDLKRGPKVAHYENEPTARDTNVLLDRIAMAHRAMEAGIFVPVDTGHWVCSKKWCGYWSDCRYARRPATVAAAKPLVQIAAVPAAAPKQAPSKSLDALFAVEAPKITPQPKKAPLFGPGGIA